MPFFRKTLFWVHLAVGLAAGLVIALSALTGATLAFEKEILAFAERDARRIAPPPADAERIPIGQLFRSLRETHPAFRVGSVSLSSDPRDAIVLQPARRPVPQANSQPPPPNPELQTPNPSAPSPALLYLNPCTGAVTEGPAQNLRAFFQLMLRWHRWLGFQDRKLRDIGGNIVSLSTACFLLLALSGLYLWWPRNGRRSALNLSLRPNLSLRGKARDWNWHNSLGFWSSPLLILITLTGLVMAWHWLGDLLYKRPEDPNPAAAPILRPEGALPLSPDALFAAAQQHAPAWETLTLRLNASPRQRTAPADAATPPVTVAVKERGSWSPLPRQLTLHPYTGELLASESLADFPPGRALRSLARPLHTGEALGFLGKFLALLASLVALVLLYTGFALALRRFTRKN